MKTEKELDWILYCPKCGHKVSFTLKIDLKTGHVKEMVQYHTRMSRKQIIKYLEKRKELGSNGT